MLCFRGLPARFVFFGTNPRKGCLGPQYALPGPGVAREWALGSLGDEVKLGCIQALSGSSLRQLAALNLDRKGVFYSDPVFLEKPETG